MQILFTKRAHRDYQSLPCFFQNIVDKQLDALIKDIRYPSLRAKKYNAQLDIWQGRINREYRFYFQIQKNNYIILTIIKHP